MALPTAAPATSLEAASDLDLAAEPSTGSYTISLTVNTDGTFMVGRDGEDAPQAADSIKEALTIALDIYRANGKATAETQFDNGFSGEY